MRENNSPMSDELAAAQAALEDIRSCGASGERIAQSAIADAVRLAAEADMNAQHLKLR